MTPLFETDYFGSWKNSIEVIGNLTVAKQRLTKLSKLEKEVKKRKKIKENKALKLKEIELEAKKQLELLDLYSSQMKKRTKKEENQMYLSAKQKEIISYARSTELKYSAYIGALPEFSIEEDE